MPLVNLNPTDLIAFRAETEYSARLTLIGHMLDDNITEAVDLEIVRWLLDTLVAERKAHRKCRDSLRGAVIHTNTADERWREALDAKRNLQQEIDRLNEERPTAPVVIHQAKVIARMSDCIREANEQIEAGDSSDDVVIRLDQWQCNYPDLIEAAKHDA